jgi:hypothetical protein
MANGQQKAQQSIESFEVWVATQSDDDFKQIIYRGSLSRGDVAKAVGCGKSALNQNPELQKQLKALEDELRERSVLPPLSIKAVKEAGKSKEYDNTANRRIMDSRRVSSLEQENIELKAEVNELKSKLERFGELSGTLAEMGMMPR